MCVGVLVKFLNDKVFPWVCMKVQDAMLFFWSLFSEMDGWIH